MKTWPTEEEEETRLISVLALPVSSKLALKEHLILSFSLPAETIHPPHQRSGPNLFISTAVDGPTRLRENASLTLHKPVVSLSVTKKSVRSGFRSHVWRREIENVFVLQVNVYLPPIWRLFLKHLSPRIKNLICSKQKSHL